MEIAPKAFTHFCMLAAPVLTSRRTSRYVIITLTFDQERAASAVPAAITAETMRAVGQAPSIGRHATAKKIVLQPRSSRHRPCRRGSAWAMQSCGMQHGSAGPAMLPRSTSRPYCADQTPV